MGLRTVVFIDYQNVYHRARDAWGDKDLDGKCLEPPMFGNVKPLRLALLLKQLGEREPNDRTLTEVRLYRGEPTAKSHPTVQAAFQRQLDSWKRVPLLTVITRPLRYNATAWDHNGAPTEWDGGREKGIDVRIALDVALGARNGDYDIGIVVSGDTDLLPAIEYGIAQHKKIENAVWWPNKDEARPLRTRGLWCHRLTEKRFANLRDDTDYAIEGTAADAL